MLGVPALVVDEDARPLGLAQEEALGQRRPLVGPLVLGARRARRRRRTLRRAASRPPWPPPDHHRPRRRCSRALRSQNFRGLRRHAGHGASNHFRRRTAACQPLASARAGRPAWSVAAASRAIRRRAASSLGDLEPEGQPHAAQQPVDGEPGRDPRDGAQARAARGAAARGSTPRRRPARRRRVGSRGGAAGSGRRRRPPARPAHRAGRRRSRAAGPASSAADRGGSFSPNGSAERAHSAT